MAVPWFGTRSLAKAARQIKDKEEAVLKTNHGCDAVWVVVCVLVLWPLNVMSQDWRPESNVEIVIPSGSGSGLDTSGRTMQRFLVDNKLLPATSSIVNKAGGGGSLAYIYLNQHPNNAHYVSVTSPGVITNKLVGASTIDFRDLTPLAQLFDENIAFMVLPESKIKDVRTLVELLKKDPASVSFGIATALGGANHIATALALKTAGVDVRRLRNVVFKSGGEVTIALLGGHVDVVPIAAPVAVPLVQTGKVKVIAVSSTNRLTGVLAVAPTWREQGIDSAYSTWRGVVGPKGMTKPAIAYWDGVFEKLTSLEGWKKSLEDNLWVSNYLNSDKSKSFLEQQYKEHHTILRDLGMTK